MCKITPILNGKDNLCWILKTKNKTKHDYPRKKCVRKYMVGRRHQIVATIAAIQSSVAVDDDLHKQVQQFADRLLERLMEKYF